GRFGYDLERPLDERRIRPGGQFSSQCRDTVPVAFAAFLESESYEEALRRAIAAGGDADTTACMAGALAGAYGGVPRRMAEHVLNQLQPEWREVVLAF